METELCLAASRSSPPPPPPGGRKSLQEVRTSTPCQALGRAASGAHLAPATETFLREVQDSNHGRGSVEPQNRGAGDLLVGPCFPPSPPSTPRGAHHLPHTHTGRLHHGSICNGPS